MNKRFPAGLLALCMAAGLMPGTAFAQEGQHTHNAGGWACTAVTEETLACAQPEHTHGEGCYDAAGALTCALAEHVHSGDCYTMAETWQCTPPAPETPGDGQPAGDETPVNQQPGEGEDSAADETPEQDSAGPSVPETPVTEEAGDGEPPADTTAAPPQTTPAASSTQPAREPSGEPSGDPAGQPAAQADDGVYQLTEETYDTVLQQAQADEHQDIVLELTEDLGSGNAFAGIAGKHVTLRSAGDAVYSIRLGSELVGELTVENVKASAGTLYCSGFKTIFTEASELTTSSTLYGGANQKDVDSTYLVVHGKARIDTADNENVVVGGCYKGSVKGDVYVELAGDISFGGNEGGHYITGANRATRYGGDTYDGDPLYVGGDVTLILDTDPAADSRPQAISGTVDSHIKGNLSITVKAGNLQGIDAQRGSAEQSRIDGSVHIVAGAPEYENTDRIYRVGYNWGIYGAGEQIPASGSEFEVGGDILIETYENVWGWDKGGPPAMDPPEIVGASNAVVAGDITIKAHGSHMANIYGVEDEASFVSEVQGGITIIAEDVELDDATGDVSQGDGHIIGGYLSNGVVRGNISITVDGGSVKRVQATFNGSRTAEKSQIYITGKPEIRYGVYGVDRADAADDSVITIDACEASIPFLYYATQVHVTGKSKVVLGGQYKPFYDTYDLRVDEESALTTEKTTALLGNASVDGASSWTMEGSTTIDGSLSVQGKSDLTNNAQLQVKKDMTLKDCSWTENGKSYLYQTLQSEGAVMAFHEYLAVGYGYRNEEEAKDVFSSKQDTVFFYKTSSTASNKVYGNAEVDHSTWTIVQPLTVTGNYNGTENTLNLVAFTDPDNYPESMIPLEIQGEASGSTEVYLVQENDLKQEGKPVVGHNYINALATSADTFVLANKNANNGEYYFKRVEDAQKDPEIYDMWQIAKMHVVTFDKNNADAGATEADPQTMFVEEQVQGPSCLAALPAAPVRSGYVFLGWNTAADGSGAAFDTAYDVTGDLTVYAQWKKQEDTPQPPADPGGSNTGTSDNGGSRPQAAPQQPVPQPAAAEAAAPAASAAPVAAIPQTGDELPAGALGGAAVAAAGALLALLALRKRRAQ